jgi:hypothetical protein
VAYIKIGCAISSGSGGVEDEEALVRWNVWCAIVARRVQDSYILRWYILAIDVAAVPYITATASSGAMGAEVDAFVGYNREAPLIAA